MLTEFSTHAYRQGWAAYREGKGLLDNPLIQPADRTQWTMGMTGAGREAQETDTVPDFSDDTEE